jgi:hypothetical protein
MTTCGEIQTHTHGGKDREKFFKKKKAGKFFLCPGDYLVFIC